MTTLSCAIFLKCEIHTLYLTHLVQMLAKIHINMAHLVHVTWHLRSVVKSSYYQVQKIKNSEIN